MAKLYPNLPDPPTPIDLPLNPNPATKDKYSSTKEDLAYDIIKALGGP